MFEEAPPIAHPSNQIRTLELAWDLENDQLTDKSLHILRLIGLHLHKMSEEDHNKIIDLLNQILKIKPLKK